MGVNCFMFWFFVVCGYLLWFSFADAEISRLGFWGLVISVYFDLL